MKGRIVATILVILFLGSAVPGASVDWIAGMWATPPSGWSITPPSPSTTDVISFQGPTDQSYGNSCVAAGAFGGTPYLSIDNATKTVELKFQGPAPEWCTMIYMPAVGFQGNFGPLAAGKWTFKCMESHVAFKLEFTVGEGAGSGHVIYVDHTALMSSLTPDGSSWARAYPYLQDGVAAARAGDTIRVADGTYKPDDGARVTRGDRAASFVIPDKVTVLCGYAGYGAADPDARNPDKYPTILTGDLRGDDLWGIVNISDNSCHVVSASGGGTLEGAIITGGNANGTGDAQYGGGVFLKAATLQISDCKIRGNKAQFGAGVACVEGVAPVLIHTEVTGNWAYIFGGALYNENARLEVTNCLIVGNTAGSADIMGSDAVFSVMGSLNINDCTIADNRPGHGAAAHGRAIVSLAWGPTPMPAISIQNSIVRNGGNEIWSTEPGVVTLYSNNMEGGTGGYSGSGNIDRDPLFKNPGGFSIEGQWIFDDDGYMLRAGSPSINAGNQALLPAGLSVDLSGYPRVQGGQVDQGAYEQTWLPPAVVLVPNVVGETQSAAESLLASFGLVVGKVDDAYSSTVPAGRVISQDPAAGSTADVGSGVNLTISQGPAPGGSWTLDQVVKLTMMIPDPPYDHLIDTAGGGVFLLYAGGTTEYKLEIAGVKAVGGTWTVDPTGGTVAAGTYTIFFTYRAKEIDVSTLPPGNQKIGEVKVYTR
jgi:hypothetical protein